MTIFCQQVVFHADEKKLFPVCEKNKIRAKRCGSALFEITGGVKITVFGGKVIFFMCSVLLTKY